jgi:hypothetical protein
MPGNWRRRLWSGISEGNRIATVQPNSCFVTSPVVRLTFNDLQLAEDIVAETIRNAARIGLYEQIHWNASALERFMKRLRMVTPQP